MRGLAVLALCVAGSAAAAQSRCYRGKYLTREVNFMKGKPWWRHDEHYHLDFSANCRPL